MILAVQIYVALGIAYFIMGMAPHWRELLEYHVEDPFSSLVTDVITLIQCAVAWPFFMYKEFTGQYDDDLE